jgi:hypothetical protein
MQLLPDAYALGRAVFDSYLAGLRLQPALLHFCLLVRKARAMISDRFGGMELPTRWPPPVGFKHHKLLRKHLATLHCCSHSLHVRSIKTDYEQSDMLLYLIQQFPTACILSVHMLVKLVQQVVDFSHRGHMDGIRLGRHGSPLKLSINAAIFTIATLQNTSDTA